MPVKSQHAAHPVVSSENKKVGTRTTGGAVLVARAALESTAAQQNQKQVYVAAVVAAARHIGPEPGQCRCACVSSINLPKIGIILVQQLLWRWMMWDVKSTVSHVRGFMVVA